MVRSTTPESAGADQTLGDLVSLAAKDISQLVRYEIDLAKSELRGDFRRAGMAGVLFGIAAFFGCLVLFTLCFAYAYLLYWAGAPGGLAGSFGFVALTLAVLGTVAIAIARTTMRRMSGMKKTRKSFTEGMRILRRDGKSTPGTQPQLPDGQRPELAGREGASGDGSPRSPGGPGGMASPRSKR